MHDIVLTTSTNNPVVDTILRTIIHSFEHVFPNRVRGYYLIGSYVEDTAVPLSDIDMFVLFANDFESLEEEELAKHQGQYCAKTSPIRLDIGAFPERKLSELHPVPRTGLKLGSSLLYGTDVREHIPLPPLSEYYAAFIEGTRYFISLLRNGAQITIPVNYPDMNAPYYGYTNKNIPEWYPLTTQFGTKELVATTTRIASSIVVRENQIYVPGKKAAVTLFQNTNNLWAQFVYEVYHRCKLDWKYRVPRARHEQQHLNDLCQQMLAFENMFLQQYCPGR